MRVSAGKYAVKHTWKRNGMLLGRGLIAPWEQHEGLDPVRLSKGIVHTNKQAETRGYKHAVTPKKHGATQNGTLF